MRFAQRGGSVSEQTEQQVEILTGSTAHEVGVRISEMVAKYAIRVVSLTGAYDPSGWTSNSYTAIVVFEEER